MFDSVVETLDAIVRDFARIEELKSGAIFNVAEHQPATLARIENAEENLTLCFEYSNLPADETLLEAALGSTVTQELFPDIRARTAQSVSHITLEARPRSELKGIAGSGTGLEAMEGMQRGFHRRLELLALMGRVALDHASPSAIYWEQSDRLFAGESFDAFAAGPVPGPLHIHPELFGPKQQALDPSPQLTGIRTQGAQYWLGGEVIINPCAHDWRQSYAAVLEFVKACSTANDTALSYGDVFSYADHEQRYRIDHVSDSDEQQSGPALLYELVPLDPIAAASNPVAEQPNQSSRAPNGAQSQVNSSPPPFARPHRTVFGRKRT